MNTKKGIIYLVRLRGSNYYAIGKTSQGINKTIANLQAANPFKICHIFHAIVEDATVAEHWLQSYFTGCQIRGQWFKLTGWDVKKCLEYMQKFEADYCLLKVAQTHSIALPETHKKP